jgi:hypothetical protein
MATATCHLGIQTIARLNWVNTQYMALKKGTLTPDRVARLNRIGFQVDPLTDTWNVKCRKLEVFHAHTGHCHVPQGYRADRTLGKWVENQRLALKKGTLEPDRVARLKRIGFQADKRTEL